MDGAEGRQRHGKGDDGKRASSEIKSNNHKDKLNENYKNFTI